MPVEWTEEFSTTYLLKPRVLSIQNEIDNSIQQEKHMLYSGLTVRMTIAYKTK